MHTLVTELKKILPFKDTTDIGDIVLIVAKEPQMLTYALITDIERDPSRKDEWWHVHFSVLAIPIQKMTWTLRTPQMTGMEVFTMGGEERFFKAVEMGGAFLSSAPEPLKLKKKEGGLKRIK